MGVRPAKIYRQIKNPSFTRREFMKSTPESKIRIFDMGDLTSRFDGKLSLIAKEDGQITHNALEAARVSGNRYLQKKAGKGGYHMKIRVFPHQILRENKMATGAGADRVQDGMRKAFGKPVGIAARIKKGQGLITVEINSNNYPIAKEALRRASSKLPIPCSIRVDV